MHTTRINFLEEQLAQHGEDSFVRYALAKEYESQGNLQAALVHFSLLRENDSDYVGLYYHLGHLYIAMDEKEKALDTFQAGIEVARKQHDQHALAELQNARVNLTMEM